MRCMHHLTVEANKEKAIVPSINILLADDSQLIGVQFRCYIIHYLQLDGVPSIFRVGIQIYVYVYM